MKAGSHNTRTRNRGPSPRRILAPSLASDIGVGSQVNEHREYLNTLGLIARPATSYGFYSMKQRFPTPVDDVEVHAAGYKIAQPLYVFGKDRP
jgi:hypothetical protein